MGCLKLRADRGSSWPASPEGFLWCCFPGRSRPHLNSGRVLSFPFFSDGVIGRLTKINGFCAAGLS